MKMTRQPDTSQSVLLMKCNFGDIITLQDGRKAKFIRNKDVRFVGEMEGTPYDIPKCLVDVGVEIERAPDESVQNDLENLEEGDYFWVNKDMKAHLFQFVSYTKNRGVIAHVNALNPASTLPTKISSSFVFHKLEGVK